MKKHFQIIYIIICLLEVGNAFSQLKEKANPPTCKKKISEFFKFSKDKKYNLAYNSWEWCFKNCPASTIKIYKYGLKIIQEKHKNEDTEFVNRLIDTIYTQRIKYFPVNLGNVYNNWATSLEKREAPKEKIFKKLALAYKADPKGLSVKNTLTYFKEIIKKNKYVDHQKIFDVYNELSNTIAIKIDKRIRELDIINSKEAKGETLSKKEVRKQKKHSILLRGLGQLEVSLSMALQDVDRSANCEQLLTLYKKGLKTQKNNVKWLHRAISVLSHKDCLKNKLYPKLVAAFKKVDHSFKASIFDTPSKIDSIKASKIREVIKTEADSYKKAAYLYKLASKYKRNAIIARQYAYEALEYQPSMGRAYLLIARLYARSANKCGNDEFSKRMVFVAAIDKVLKAKEVDPSISSIADKYIKSYMASIPSTKYLSVSGKKYYIKCWIGETIIIP